MANTESTGNETEIVVVMRILGMLFNGSEMDVLGHLLKCGERNMLELFLEQVNGEAPMIDCVETGKCILDVRLMYKLLNDAKLALCGEDLK